jgi:hypothetical protein
MPRTVILLFTANELKKALKKPSTQPPPARKK